MKLRALLAIASLGFAAACSERPVLTDTTAEALNAPVSMTMIPGTSLAVLANANVDLADLNGSIVAVDLDTRTILTETAVEIRSFAGQVWADPDRSRLYIADRGDDALLAYDYAVPGTDGQPISFSGVAVTDPAEDTEFGVRVDEDPFGVLLAKGTARGDVVLVSNMISGTLAVVSPDDLTSFDYDPGDSKIFGFRLFSAASFRESDNKSNPPGKGANRIVPDPNGALAYVTSTIGTGLYVIDLKDLGIEAMLDLSSILPSSPGMRGLAIDSSRRAYLASYGVGGVVVLDLSNVKEDGNDYEVLEPQLKALVLTGRNPDGVALSTDEQRLFVSNLGDNTVSVVDTTTLRVISTVSLDTQSPGELLLDSTRGVVYVLGFLSNRVTVLDEMTGAVVGTIE